MEIDLKELEERVGYHFQNPEFLKRALTHRSWAYEQGQRKKVSNQEIMNQHYERLEFLGDAVVDLVVSHLLMEKFPQAPEGDLSRIRARLVNVNQLAKLAKSLGLDRYLFLGKGEEATGGRKKFSILADVYEALCAGVYLDGGYQAVFEMIKSHFQPILEKIDLSIIEQDYTTRLQELVQAEKKKAPRYRLISATGPDHNKTFYVQVLIDREPVAQGRGKSKKQAEQNAAKKALEILTNLDKMKKNEKA